jgi:osmoprotectant transport system substrate-binding protein
MWKLLRSTLCSTLAAGLLAAGPMAFAASGDKPLAQKVDLSGASFTVGSKEFTEQEILGQMTIDLLKAAGADVSDQTGLAGSNAARNALTSGKIDMYWEYTGTAWVSYLGHTTTNIKGRLFKKVAKQDLQKHGIKWLKPARFNDSYVMLANPKIAKKYNLKTLSDLGPLIKKHADVATLCVGNEFFERDDGLRGLEKKYGWKFPRDNVSVIQESLVYGQVAQGQRCNFGDGYSSTDGRIPHLHLVALKDNQHFFPPYYAALTMREKTFKKYPQLAKLFGPLAKALTQDTMISLNSKVDVQGEFPEQVAQQFLVKHHFISD